MPTPIYALIQMRMANRVGALGMLIKVLLNILFSQLIATNYLFPNTNFGVV